jgi:hypothetical protein
MKKAIAITVLLLTTNFLGSNANAAETTNPYGTSVVDPAGPNEVIFTVSKSSKKIEFTTSKLFMMKTKVISIYEPFLKKRQTFTVIPMRTFFSSVGINGKDKVRTKALNDYIYSNSASNFISANAYIAIKRDGVEIPYDQGGPLRLIFADNSKWAKKLDAWNWSLISISVK